MLWDRLQRKVSALVNFFLLMFGEGEKVCVVAKMLVPVTAIQVEAGKALEPISILLQKSSRLVL
jgi:hypothetical protein